MSQINRDILSISRCDVQYRGDKMAAFGLKSCHASYLMEICENPGISQDQLAQAIFINKSNVARQVAFLEESGYVERRPSQADRRVMELYPMEKALELLPQIREITAAWENHITEDLTAQEIDTIAKLLAKMKARAAQWVEER